MARARCSRIGGRDMGKKRGGGRQSIPNRSAARNLPVVRKALAVLEEQKRRQDAALANAGLSRSSIAAMAETWKAPLAASAVTADPDDLHLQQLLAYQNALMFASQVLSGASHLSVTLASLALELQDPIEGRTPVNIRPVEKPGRGKQRDPNRDWFPRAMLAEFAERTKRLTLTSEQRLNETEADRIAYGVVLRRADMVMERRFGLPIEDVFPGRNDLPRNRPFEDQSNRSERWEYDKKIERVAKRCARHKADFDESRRGPDSEPPPPLSLQYYRTKLCEIDQAERAGSLTAPSDAEIETLCTFLRISFDRADHERRLLRIEEELIAAPTSAA